MKLANFSILKNVKIAAKKFKRRLSAKAFSELDKNILELINDFTGFKLPQIRLKPKTKKTKYFYNELFILKSAIYLSFVYFKSNFILKKKKLKLN